MKLSVASLGKFVLVNLVLAQYNKHGVSAVKLELHTFLPDTLRKAKQGFNKLLRRSPVTPVLVIPKRTGIASIDQALFQTTQIGSTMQGSLARQISTLMISESVAPNIFMVLLSIIPGSQLDHFVSNLVTAFTTTEQAASVKDGFQYLQMIVRVFVSSQIMQVVFVTLKDVIMNHASIINPTAQKAIELFPAAIPKLAILALMAHGVMKFYNAVARTFLHKEPSTSAASISPITTDDNEFIATFTPIHFEEDDSVVVTDIACNPEFLTMPASTESAKEDKSFEVNVTKISAVLDRFESKILSLVGGTRFHPSPVLLEEDEVHEKQTDENVMVEPDITINESADMMDPCDDDSANMAQEFEIHTADTIETEETKSMEKECIPSLKSYEIALSSSPSSPIWSTFMTPSSKAAVRALGVIACAFFSENVLPPVVRQVVALFAGLFILGMLVQEIRGVFSNCENANTLDSLIHDIEARTSAYASEMEPLVVSSRPTSRSSLRFWRTRLPILDGIATFSSHFVSRDSLNDDTEAESDIKEVHEDAVTESHQFESDVHYFNETQEEAPKAVASPPKNVWRWMSPVYAQPKMTRTACTAIVGM